MERLTIIVTMAGMGMRFYNAGYKIPKYMIEAKGKTLFEWSIESLVALNQNVEKYIFVVQRKHDAKDFIKLKISKYDIKNIEIVELDKSTDGQATTCMSAISYCSPTAPILIYNIDTYIEPGNIRYGDFTGDGHIPCFNAEGNQWSFVKTNSLGKVVEVAEKNRISDNCSVGAYYFGSAQLFKETYYTFYKNNSNLINGEKYIAPMYNKLISDGHDVTFKIIDNSKVHILGTPEDVKKFIDS